MVFCVLLVVLCWQTPVRAASAPPTIDEIVGTYAVTDKDVFYYFDKGLCGQCHSFPTKENYSLTWHITKLSDSMVQMYIDQWDMLFTAYYSNGFLIQSSGDMSTGPGYFRDTGLPWVLPHSRVNQGSSSSRATSVLVNTM